MASALSARKRRRTDKEDPEATESDSEGEPPFATQAPETEPSVIALDEAALRKILQESRLPGAPRLFQLPDLVQAAPGLDEAMSVLDQPEDVRSFLLALVPSAGMIESDVCRNLVAYLSSLFGGTQLPLPPNTLSSLRAEFNTNRAKVAHEFSRLLINRYLKTRRSVLGLTDVLDQLLRRWAEKMLREASDTGSWREWIRPDDFADCGTVFSRACGLFRASNALEWSTIPGAEGNRLPVSNVLQVRLPTSVVSHFRGEDCYYLRFQFHLQEQTYEYQVPRAAFHAKLVVSDSNGEERAWPLHVSTVSET